MTARDFVLDASVTMAWCFESQADTGTREAQRRLLEARAHVPLLWPLEVANALVAAERRRLLAPADSARFLGLLASLPVAFDPGAPGRAWGAVLGLARLHGLSVYDAAYLELALRSGLALATRDAGLRRAAADAGVEVI